MSFVDWLIVAVLLIFVSVMALTTRKFSKTVAGFLSANRCAGRYLLCIAQHEASTGALYVIAFFEVFYKAGWSLRYWSAINIPLTLFLALSGFMVYRYRQTRAMTMAQFLEMRYSRRFRLFAGILCWISGLINFGIFPAVGAEFFMNFCNLPHDFQLLGLSIPTFPLLMAVLLSLGLFFVFISGQVGVLVTDFWQGFFATFAFMAIIAFLIFKFPWETISSSLVIVSKPGNSLINPYDIKNRPDFGMVYFLMTTWFNIYYMGAWQGASAFGTSAISAHEAKMSPIVGTFRQAVVALGLIIMPLCALAYMNLPQYADGAAAVTAGLEKLYPGAVNDHLRFRMLVPTVMSVILPVGLVGAFTAVMLGYFISTNNTMMHSWGTIFVQDVICPLRKKPLSTKSHLLLLRLSILLVAVFAFCFSMIFKLQDFINMFMQVTGAVYMAGAGAVILGGLYWKRGSTAGAWAALISGAVLSIIFMILQQSTSFMSWINSSIPIWQWNGVSFAFVAGIIALLTYVLVSIFGSKQVADMDKLLHRGQYAVADEQLEINKHAEHKKLKWYWRMIGVRSDEFSLGDRLLFMYTFLMRMVWDLGGFVVTLILTALGLMTTAMWIGWWHISIYISIILACIGGVWISIGGLYDLKRMYNKLSTITCDETDDGRVEKSVVEKETESPQEQLVPKA